MNYNLINIIMKFYCDSYYLQCSILLLYVPPQHRRRYGHEYVCSFVRSFVRSFVGKCKINIHFIRFFISHNI